MRDLSELRSVGGDPSKISLLETSGKLYELIYKTRGRASGDVRKFIPVTENVVSFGPQKIAVEDENESIVKVREIPFLRGNFAGEKSGVTSSITIQP